MERIRLGRFTVISLTALVVVPMLVLLNGMGTTLTRGQNTATKVVATLAGLLLLTLLGGLAARRWPALFSDEGRQRGPRPTPLRLGTLAALLVLWVGALVWWLSTEPSRAPAGPVLASSAVWYLVLVGAIYLLESTWLKHDAR